MSIMSSAGNPNPNPNPNPWAPSDTYKDCSQGICSLYCPQWCYFIFPPPPPFGLSGDDSGGSSDFSPLIIAVIGILASAFILVSYYTIVSKYCRGRGGRDNGIEFHENRHEMDHANAWTQQAGSAAGLDESLIKSIKVCKYKKGDGLVEGTDCSVCLSEFQEDESLRLMPKCNHAFHVPCIDTWLKSHSSCPLCRANIDAPEALLPVRQVSTPIEPRPSVNASAFEYSRRNDALFVIQDLETGVREEGVVSPVVGENDGVRPLRRSVSLSSCPSQGQVSIADILRVSEDDEDYPRQSSSMGIGSSKQFDEEQYKQNNRSGVFNLVRSPLAMKRSVSTGRFMSSTRYEKEGTL